MIISKLWQTEHLLLREEWGSDAGCCRYTLDLRLASRPCSPSAVFNQYQRSILTSNHSGIVLEKVAEYFYYNHKNRNKEDVPDMEIPPELCLELLMAADFLDGNLLHQSTQLDCANHITA